MRRPQAAPKVAVTMTAQQHWEEKTESDIVPILGGNSEIGAHVYSVIGFDLFQVFV